MVVPTYNERARLDTLLEQIFAACHRHNLATEVVIVDDNSADGTGIRADEWAKSDRVRVIHRPGKLGLGSAVLDGIAIAQAPIVGVMDADLSHPPDLIPSLYSAMVTADLDMIVGSRYVSGGDSRSFSFSRAMLSRAGCLLSRPLTPVRDPMSGFFLIRRERTTGLQTSVRGFKIGLELLVRTAPRRVAEMGYRFAGREAGESKMSTGEGLRFLRQLAVLYTDATVASSARPSYQVISAADDRAPSASAPGRARA